MTKGKKTVYIDWFSHSCMTDRDSLIIYYITNIRKKINIGLTVIDDTSLKASVLLIGINFEISQLKEIAYLNIESIFGIISFFVKLKAIKWRQMQLM